MARYLEVLLRARYPEGVFEVIPVAMTAINSHALLPMARECTALGADFWLVYAGNNEMLGPFGAGSTLGQGTPPLALVRLVLAAKATRIGQAVEALVGRFRGRPSGSTRWAGLRALAGEQLAGDAPERARIGAAFERNLRDLIHTGRSAGARVLLSTVAVNLRDCAPVRLHASPGAGGRRLASGPVSSNGRQALTNADPAALAAFASAATLDRQPAALHFLIGEAELARTNLAQAREAFTLAGDLDTIPLRADSRLNGIVRRLAGEFRAAPRRHRRSPGEGKPLRDSRRSVLLRTRPSHAGGQSRGRPGLCRGARRGIARIRAPPRGGRLAVPGDRRHPAGVDRLEPLRRGRTDDAPLPRRPVHQPPQPRGAAPDAGPRSVPPATRPNSGGGPVLVVASTPTRSARRREDPHLRRNFAEFLGATGALADAAAQWQKIVELLPTTPSPTCKPAVSSARPADWTTPVPSSNARSPSSPTGSTPISNSPICS